MNPAAALLNPDSEHSVQWDLRVPPASGGVSLDGLVGVAVEEMVWSLENYRTRVLLSVSPETLTIKYLLSGFACMFLLTAEDPPGSGFIQIFSLGFFLSSLSLDSSPSLSRRHTRL